MFLSAFNGSPGILRGAGGSDREKEERKTLARISSGGGQAFKGNRMGSGDVGERQNGKRGRRPPYFPAAPLIMPYYLLGATILRSFVGKKEK